VVPNVFLTHKKNNAGPVQVRPAYKPVAGGWLRQWLGSVTARRERMYVAYGAALRACALWLLVPNVFEPQIPDATTFVGIWEFQRRGISRGLGLQFPNSRISTPSPPLHCRLTRHTRGSHVWVHV
jgi:hypothetical protein